MEELDREMKNMMQYQMGVQKLKFEIIEVNIFSIAQLKIRYQRRKNNLQQI